MWAPARFGSFPLIRRAPGYVPCSEATMRTLAIEQSTGAAGVALLEDTRVLAEESWMETRGRAGHLFEALPRVLELAGCTVDEIGLFAIGLGPGSFSGLRTSLSAANHLALPGLKPVFGVPSAQALARRVMTEEDTDSVAVVGDARRKRLWYAVFRRRDKAIRPADTFSLINTNELASALDNPAILVSPDWDRIADVLRETAGGTRIIAEPRTPSARDVGRLAAMAFDPARPPAPPEPIYMHPPVFVEPKFPQRPTSG